MKFLSIFSNSMLYVGWALISSVLLAITCAIDPYVFGFTALGAAWLSGAFVLGTLIRARQAIAVGACQCHSDRAFLHAALYIQVGQPAPATLLLHR